MTGRREFLRQSATAAAAAAAGTVLSGCAEPGEGGAPPAPATGEVVEPAVVQPAIPRWRGFNLLEMFTTQSKGDFQEDDFRWMSDWGFDFARIPMCYTLWIVGDDVYDIYEPMLENVDRVVEYAKYGIHICLNFHRAPGYSVNREREEPFNLWKDQEALDAFCFHWQLYARRYKGISPERLSFNLVNEPTDPTRTMSRADHERVVRAAVRAIREVDPERLIVVDGLRWGREPVPELIDLGLVQSCRAYEPMNVSHYEASWVDSKGWPEPVWPGRLAGGERWDRRKLERFYRPWTQLAGQGVAVHCGEGGAFNRTPHEVFLGWFRDVLEILTGAGIGYALWNLRGSFGVLDSGRADVAYEEWHGHQLDRKLLNLLQEF
jgi:endoglucanase